MLWRRRLPHWVPEDSIVFVTWRLAGTLPQAAPELEIRDPRPGKIFLFRDRQLDRSPLGPRWLEDPQIATLFVDALLHGESVRRAYELIAWVVMPNHVHLVLKPNRRLSEIMRWLKTATATRANRLLGKRADAFWQREYFDRWIRSNKELVAVVAYVEANPVAAGLAACPQEWPWSSACKDTGGKTAGATRSA
jgi:putative transposase